MVKIVEKCFSFVNSIKIWWDKKQNHMIPEMSLTLFFLRNFIATALEMMEMRRPSYCKNNLTTEILKPKNISKV